MGIDADLLNRQSEPSEADKAGDFRAATRDKLEEKVEEGASLRERVQQKKTQETKNTDNDESSLSSTSGVSPILKGTDEALKFAWENLITSWGLTLIWIDIHFFLNKVFGPSVFREPGEEWIPDNIKKVASKTKQAASMLRIIEGAGCGCLNLGCLFLVIAFLSLVALIVSGISNPLYAIKILFGSLWNWFTGGK